MREKTIKKPIDMGKDPIKKCVVKLALPMMVAQLVNMLYSMVDRIYIGNIPEIGTTAFAGMIIAYPILIIVGSFCALGGFGASPLVAMKLGEGDRDEAERIMTNAFYVLTAFGIILTAILAVFHKELLWLFGASPDNFPYAEDYLTMYMLGTIFVMFSIGMNVFISAQGYSKRAMMSVLIGAIINIILDPIFIFGFNMATRGAALATVIAQFCSAVFVLSFLIKKNGSLCLNFKKHKPDMKIIGVFLALGIAPWLMQATEAVVQILFNVQMTTFGGEMKDYLIATIGVCVSIMQIVLIPVGAFAQGSAPFISYNYGMGDMTRVRKSVKFMVTTTFLLGLFVAVCAICFPAQLARVFNHSPIVIAYCEQYMPTFFAGLTLMGMQMGLQNVFLSLGKAKISMFLASLRKIILLIPILIFLPRIMGVDGVFWAECISDFIAMGTTILTFLLMFNKILDKREKENELKGIHFPHEEN